MKGSYDYRTNFFNTFLTSNFECLRQFQSEMDLFVVNVFYIYVAYAFLLPAYFRYAFGKQWVLLAAKKCFDFCI